MIITIYHKIKNNNNGQGLLEVVISLGIIVSGIIGALTLTVSNQTSSTESSEQLIAVNLAREGIEVIRNKRDSNWLARRAWNYGFENASFPNDYTVMFYYSNFTNQPTMNNPNITFFPNDFTDLRTRIWRKNGFYFQFLIGTPTNSTLTPYKRLIYLDKICADKTIRESGSTCTVDNPQIGIRVKSVVQWESKENTNNVTMEEHLFNWR